MPTTIEWPCPQNRGGQKLTFTWPKELRQYGYPTPPMQPAASYPTLLTQIQNLIEQGDINEAISFMMAEYVTITTADLVTSLENGQALNCYADGDRGNPDQTNPLTALMSLQDWISTHLQTLPPCFAGPPSSWCWNSPPNPPLPRSAL